MPWFVIVLISLAIEVLAFLIMPKAKATPPAVQDLQAPTADAGRPKPVIFGSIKIIGTNVLNYTDVSTKSYTTSGSSGGK